MTIQNPKEIDLVTRDPKTSIVHLVMIEDRIWDGSLEKMYELQKKVNLYLEFALDGEFEKMYPDLKDLPIKIELMAVQEPD